MFDQLTVLVVSLNAIWIAIDTDNNDAVLVSDADPVNTKVLSQRKAGIADRQTVPYAIAQGLVLKDRLEQGPNGASSLKHNLDTWTIERNVMQIIYELPQPRVGEQADAVWRRLYE
ncbi:hypothetical protein AK812_SmicGene38144 [Symbiodinium microadriaticum]|uniref:Uncharacterized protein n=1 Tax=Symbiodinium microadriaticum TaxID=2951 RepID=A0A1Q9CEJ0_SYMMI|nr:hypothetical protein AK812_SmicGene38144 [Symbiodinium microadriaticum]